jgi:hypothetical protein
VSSSRRRRRAAQNYAVRGRGFRVPAFVASRRRRDIGSRSQATCIVTAPIHATVSCMGTDRPAIWRHFDRSDKPLIETAHSRYAARVMFAETCCGPLSARGARCHYRIAGRGTPAPSGLPFLRCATTRQQVNCYHHRCGYGCPEHRHQHERHSAKTSLSLLREGPRRLSVPCARCADAILCISFP